MAATGLWRHHHSTLMVQVLVKLEKLTNPGRRGHRERPRSSWSTRCSRAIESSWLVEPVRWSAAEPAIAAARRSPSSSMTAVSSMLRNGNRVRLTRGTRVRWCDAETGDVEIEMRVMKESNSCEFEFTTNNKQDKTTRKTTVERELHRRVPTRLRVLTSDCRGGDGAASEPSHTID